MKVNIIMLVDFIKKRGNNYMAEFCIDCFKELLFNDYEDSQIILSDNLDICEGCAEFKRVVIRIID